jgi:hypothetical protein
MTTPPTMTRDDDPRLRFQEPLRSTLARTGAIALVGGGLLTVPFHRLSQWPTASFLMLWPALGGHFVEIFFLNYLRPRLTAASAAQIGVRVGVWFIGGVALALAMRLTATALVAPRAGHWPAWWVGGLAFIGIELAVHVVLWLRGRPSFYDE